MRHTLVPALATLMLAACAGGSDPIATTDATPTPTAASNTLPTALATAVESASSAAPIVLTAATAQDSNLQLAQIVDVDAYLASPAVHVMFSAASAKASCAPVVGDLKFQLPKTMAAVAGAALKGIEAGAIGLITGGGKKAVIVGAAAGGASLIGSLVTQLPGLLTSFKDVAACAKGAVTKSVDTTADASTELPDVPAFDPQGQGCVVIRLGGHTVTNCSDSSVAAAGH